MPKIVCTCGYVHDLSPIPDAGWLTVRDADYEALLAAEATRGRPEVAGARRGMPPAPELLAADQLVHAMTGLLYACPQCGELLWQPPGSATFRRYRPVE